MEWCYIVCCSVFRGGNARERASGTIVYNLLSVVQKASFSMHSPAEHTTGVYEHLYLLL